MAGLGRPIHEKETRESPVKSGDEGLLTVVLTGGIVL